MNNYGTGIGLYTSKMIINQIGPSENLTISSEEGIGSDFSFYMYQNVDDNIINNKL